MCSDGTAAVKIRVHAPCSLRYCIDGNASLCERSLIDVTDIAGCYILRPYAHQIWDKIHSWFDGRIAALGVENCYFPLLITKKALETEASHVEGFAAEVDSQVLNLR